jgi:hypothetical protein
MRATITADPLESLNRLLSSYHSRCPPFIPIPEKIGSMTGFLRFQAKAGGVRPHRFCIFRPDRPNLPAIRFGAPWVAYEAMRMGAAG